MATPKKTNTKRRQCPSVYVNGKGGTVNTTFCTKMEGHVQEGDPEHKGFRKRWMDPSVNVGDVHKFVKAIR